MHTGSIMLRRLGEFANLLVRLATIQTTIIIYESQEF